MGLKVVGLGSAICVRTVSDSNLLELSPEKPNCRMESKDHLQAFVLGPAPRLGHAESNH